MSTDGFSPEPTLDGGGEPELDRESWAQTALTDLGANIRIARQAAGMRQEDLAEAVGRTQTVRHLHVHIVPRHDGDGLHLPWTGQSALPEGRSANA